MHCNGQTNKLIDVDFMRGIICINVNQLKFAGSHRHRGVGWIQPPLQHWGQFSKPSDKNVFLKNQQRLVKHYSKGKKDMNTNIKTDKGKVAEEKKKKKLVHKIVPLSHQPGCHLHWRRKPAWVEGGGDRPPSNTKTWAESHSDWESYLCDRRWGWW